MEHWFDRATKLFAGGTISRRGLLESGAAAGTSVLLAQRSAVARLEGAGELAQLALPTSLAPCTLTDHNGTAELTFAAQSSYKGQALTLRGVHRRTGIKHPSGAIHVRVDLAGKPVLEIVHSATQSGTSKGRGNPVLQGAVSYGSGYSGVRHVAAVTHDSSVTGFVDGRAFTGTGGQTSGHMRDGKAAPATHVDPALAEAVRALFASAAGRVAQCHGATHHASESHGSVATRSQLFAPLRELARRTAAAPQELAQTFGGGPCADCYNGCDAKMVMCQVKAFASCASGPWCLFAIGACVNSWKDCNAGCFQTGGPCCAVKCHPPNVGEATCCPSGTKCCGDACCSSSTPVCQYPTSEAANYGFCCPSGTYGCRTVSQGWGTWYYTCCAKGTACCGSLCCGADQYCASSAGLICCPKGQALCGGQCCSGKCLKDGVGNEFCCASGSMCGSQCCTGNDKCLTSPTGSKLCCNGSLCGGKCCGPGAICHNGQCAYGKPCGKGFCGLTNPVCCNGVCCASNQTCVKGKCTTAACKKKGTVPCQFTPGLCCKPGSTCCGTKCCKPGTNCCGGTCTNAQCIQ